MRQLTPLILREKYYRGIEFEINRMLLALIYVPISRLFRKPVEFLNALNSPLWEGIIDGRIWYVDGIFRGEFNSKISRALERLGARYNPLSKTYSLSPDLFPAELRMAQAHADARYENLRRGILRTLDDVDIESITRHSQVTEKVGQAIEWMNDDFKKTVSSVTIPPRLSEDQRRMLAHEWGQNLKLYIKDWASDDILKLREKVQSHAFEGRRAESLAKIIQENYGVSKRKAKFLARQETSLLMSKFRESRYKQLGITRYRWRGSMDERERPDHRALEGKVFSFDSPPITNKATGARNNPGEDFGCRCVAIALVE